MSRKRGVIPATFALTVLTGSVLGSASPVGAAVAPEAEAVLTEVRQTDSLLRSDLRSGHLLIREEMQDTKTDPPRRYYTGETEVWFDGVRFRLDLRQTWYEAEGQPASQETLSLFDGERLLQTQLPGFLRTHLAFPRELSEIRRYVGLGGASLLLHWPLADPVYHGGGVAEAILRSANDSLDFAGQASLGDLACVVLSAPLANSPSRFWLAPQRGYAVARYDFTASDGSLVVDQVDEWMEPVSGLWLPKVAVRSVEDPETGQLRRPAPDRTEVLASTFNGPIPDEVFHLDLPEGVNTEPFPER
jgi:hypothetical protein